MAAALTPSQADQAAAVRELIRRHGLRYFISRFWHVVEPGVDYVDTWHIGAICEALEAIEAGQIKRLVINVPPSTGKSVTVSVFWPAWSWTRDPALRWITTAFGQDLVYRDAEKHLEIVKSPLFQACWPEVQLTRRRPPVSLFTTTAGGRRYAAQLGGELTGWHGERIILDDPIKPNDADAVSGVRLEETNKLVSATLSSRLIEGPKSAVVCIMQRLAAGDPADLLLDQGYEHLMLPMRYTPNASWDRGCSLGKLDKRTEKGELLCPDRLDEYAVKRLEVALETPQARAAQHDQNPTPKAGAFFEDAWFRRWKELPKGLRFVQTWDLGMKGKTGKNARQAHSRVHGALWAFETGRSYYLVDEVIGTWNYPETKKQFALAQARPGWTEIERILVENKANGIPLIDELKATYPLIYPVEPAGAKEDRAARHSAVVEAGQVWVPDSSVHPWSQEFVTELVRFPKQKHNDRVDTTSQFLDYARDKNAQYLQALQELGPQLDREGLI